MEEYNRLLLSHAKQYGLNIEKPDWDEQVEQSVVEEMVGPELGAYERAQLVSSNLRTLLEDAGITGASLELCSSMVVLGCAKRTDVKLDGEVIGHLTACCQAIDIDRFRRECPTLQPGLLKNASDLVMDGIILRQRDPEPVVDELHAGGGESGSEAPERPIPHVRFRLPSLDDQ